MSPALPLTGVRVADFTWVGAGPYVTKPLADHGADVIKVESSVRLDPIREMRPFRDGLPGVNRSGYFANRNSSKRSICLNLTTDKGRELALRLAAMSDVVVNNFTPRTMDRLGLGYEAISDLRPDIIYVTMPMQGDEGPHSGFRGYGLTIAALTGIYALTGYEDREPVGTGTNYPDHVANPLHTAIAILSALKAKQRTGKGQYIELAQIESTLNLLGPSLLAAQLPGEPPRRRGNRDPRAAPHGVYRCTGEDRWCALAVFDDAQWRGFVDALGRPAWTKDERYETIRGRLAHVEDLDSSVQLTVEDEEAEDLAARLRQAGVPASVVKNAADLLVDEQLLERGHWVRLDHPEMGSSVYDAPPYRLSGSPGSLRSPAPLLGADTEAVALEMFGLSEAEYAAFETEGVFI